MTQGWVDRVIFNAANGGTGDFVVASAEQGYNTPAQSNAVDGTSYHYSAELRDSAGTIIDWEVGTGPYTAGTTTVARTTIEFSSNANAKVNFSSPPQVMITALATDFTTGLRILPSALSYFVAILAGTITGGALYTAGTYTAVSLTGGSGTGARATITVTGSAVSDVVPTVQGTGYVVGDVLSAAAADIGGTGSGFTFTLTGVGSDSNTGFTQATCFRTFAKAYNTIGGFALSPGYGITVTIADGIYAEQLIAPSFPGAIIQQIVWTGNQAKPQNCALRPTSNPGLVGVLHMTGIGNYWRGIHFDGRDAGFGGWEAVTAFDANSDTLDCHFSIASNDFWYVMRFNNSSVGVSRPSFNLDGNQLSAAAALGKSTLLYNTPTLLSGTPTWNFFAPLDGGGINGYLGSVIEVGGTFTGWGSVTGPRVGLISDSHLINLTDFTATYLPGSTRGTIDAGSSYDGARGSLSIAGAPTTTDVPIDQTYKMIKNTGSGAVVWAFNDGGTIKTVALV